MSDLLAEHVGKGPASFCARKPCSTSRRKFVLDEPEAALSPQRQLALMVRIHQLVQAGSQFVISTHSPILLAYPGATIFHLDRTGIRQTRYEETEHYAVTRAFLQDPAGRLRILFAESDDDVDDD